MSRKSICLLLLISLLVSISIYGQLRLKDRHPDEPASYTFNERFSAKRAIAHLKQIDGSLQSFRLLTELGKTKFSQAEMAKIGHTEPDAQTLGFYNLVHAIEGTVRKQEYQIKKLEYELAQAKFDDGKIRAKEFAQKKFAYQKAEKDFQAFWDKFQVSD
jgi:hypothetical protein